MPPKVSDTDFVRLFESLGAHKTARQTNMHLRSVYSRRERLEQKIGRQITAPIQPTGSDGTRHHIAHSHRIYLDVPSGVVLVGSDAHIWPGPLTTAMRGFIRFCKELKPAAVILNGDVLDFPQISRHPPIGWTKLPSVQEEVEAAQDVLAKIEKVTFKTRKIWTLGNHDSRFETRIATIAPEFAKVAGTSLRDHFPNWEPCWSAWINDNTVVKHRFKGGDHAPFNNAIKSGKHMITGHLHSAKVIPWSDYNGTRYGVDGGCLAEPEAKAFVDYTEDNPKNWRSGFVVLTYCEGELLPPELVLCHDTKRDCIIFRGEIIKV